MEIDQEFRDHARRMLDFIEDSPSCFHVIENLEKRFIDAGFIGLRERDAWEIRPGGKYYVIRNDASVIAFCVPRDAAGAVKGFHMVATHSDSPSFKVKENPETTVEKQYVRLNTEKYGGMIMSSWLDRPLSVAGRVAFAGDGEILTRTVNVDRDLVVIPNLAIHMNRDMNKGVEYNPQVDMMPLYAGVGAGGDESGNDEAESIQGMLLREVAESLGIRPDEILGHDLFLYVREHGRIVGHGGEFVHSPQLDDLQCVYAASEAFLTSEPKEYISVCAVFDNEEVGSRTRHGADSTFLEDVLERICDGLAAGYGNGNPRTLQKRLIAESFLISADNAHAVHPNHPEKADQTNRPYLNGGIVIKYHGGQKYTTDAVTAATMKEICNRANVPFQTYANRSDIPGGSTLGNLSAGHVPVPTVDIGLPQLAMHSAVETGGVKDTAYAVKALRIFFGE